jgi:hypothetical protein
MVNDLVSHKHLRIHFDETVPPARGDLYGSRSFGKLSTITGLSTVQLALA